MNMYYLENLDNYNDKLNKTKLAELLFLKDINDKIM